MGHVAIPFKWKEFLFHGGFPYNVTSIFKSGLIAGGRERKEGRQTIFFTPLIHSGEPSDDFSKPRKAHYHWQWTSRQDAVYWINLARAQEKDFNLGRQDPRALIVYNSVPADCIYKVISQKRGKNFKSKTLNTSACPENSSQECLAITAATAEAARHNGDFCFREHQESGARRGPRYPNIQPVTMEHLETGAKY